MSGISARKMLGKLWRQRGTRWLLFAMKRVRYDADAEDVVQNAMVHTLAADPEFHSEDQANAYVLAAIRSTLAMRARSFDAATRFWDRLAYEAESSRDHRTPLDRLVELENSREAQELLDRVLEEIENLPAEEREALELTLVREPRMTLTEAAERQDVAVSTVHYRVKRALQKLQDLLGPRDHE